MAKKRVNVTVLAVVLTVLVGGAGSGYILYAKSGKSKTRVYLASGDEAFKKGDYKTAAENYKRFVSRNNNDIVGLMGWGESVYRLSYEDPDNLRTANSVLDKVVSLQPGNLEAQRLRTTLKRDIVVMGGGSTEAALRDAETAADQLRSIDPQSQLARETIAAVRLSEAQKLGGDITGPKFIAALDSVKKLVDESPTNAAISGIYTQMLAIEFTGKFATDPASSGETLDTLQARLDAYVAALDAAGGGTGEQKVELHSSRRALLVMKGQLASTTDRKAAEDIYKQSVDELEIIAKELEATNPRDVELSLGTANLLRQFGRAEAGLALLKAVHQRHPDQYATRISLADRLGERVDSLDEAIKLLRDPFTPDAEMIGLRGQMHQGQSYLARLMLAEMLVRKASVPNQGDKDALLTQADTLIKETESRFGAANSGVNHVKGLIAMQRQNFNSAVPLLRTALQGVRPEQVEDYAQYSLDLARANAALGQTGAARDTLTELTNRLPTYPLIRRQLVELYLQEKNFDEAAKQLEILKKISPDDPSIATLTPLVVSNDPQKLRELLAKTPEDTADNKRRKLMMAIVAKDEPTIKRLSDTLLGENPADLAIIPALVQRFVDQQQPEQAIALVDRGLAKEPDNGVLRQFKARLSGDTTAIRTETQDSINKIADPYRRALTQAQFDGQSGDNVAMLKALEEADKLDTAGDGAALEQLFGYYATNKEWDRAEAYLARLVKTNRDQAGGELYRTRLLLGRGKIPEALRSAQQLNAQLPDFALSWLVLGQAQLASAQYDNAARSFDQVISRQPNNLDAVRGAVQANLALNRDEALRPLLQRGLTLAPSDRYFVEMLENYELDRGDAAKVLPVREARIKTEDKDPAIWIQLGAAYMSNYRRASRENKTQAANEFLAKGYDTIVEGSKRFPADSRFRSLIANYARLANRSSEAEANLRSFFDAATDATQASAAARTLAQFYVNADQRPKAAEALNAFLAKYPPESGIVLSLSQLEVENNQPEQALAALSKMPNSPELLQQRVEILSQLKRLDEARKSAQEALLTARGRGTGDLASRQQLGAALLLAAIVEIRDAKLDAASKLIEEVLQSDPENLQAHFFRAGITLNQPAPDLESAARDLELVRDRVPNRTDARVQLSLVYDRLNRPDNAIAALESAWRDNGEDKQLLLTLINRLSRAQPPAWERIESLIAEARRSQTFANDADLTLTEAQVYLTRNQIDRAATLLKQAQASSADPRFKQAYIQTLLRGGKFRDVLSETDELIKQGDNAPTWALRDRGIALARSSKPQDAREMFSKALALADAKSESAFITDLMPVVAREIGFDAAVSLVGNRAETDLNWRYLVAMLYKQDSKLQQSMTTLQKIVEQKGGGNDQLYIESLRELGTMALTIDPIQASLARQVFLDLIAVSPNDIGALNNLAYAITLPNSGASPSDALQYSRKGYDLMKQRGMNDPLILDTHGWALVLADKTDDGVKILTEALALRKIPEIHYHLGEAFVKLNRPVDARNMFTDGLAQIDATVAAGQAVDPSLRSRMQASLDKVR